MSLTLRRIGNSCHIEYIPTAATVALAETVKPYLTRYFFLLPQNQAVTLEQFSEMIKQYSTHPNCIADANKIAKIAGA